MQVHKRFARRGFVYYFAVVQLQGVIDADDPSILYSIRGHSDVSFPQKTVWDCVPSRGKHALSQRGDYTRPAIAWIGQAGILGQSHIKSQ
ncbi:MAG: hypothetical protein Kow0077_19070 [Anaerolineae bacterium]